MERQQRRQREIARTRDDILLAAARVMGKTGRAATMRDIAGEAGFTAASLYTYFKSKQEILRGFVDLLSGEFRRTFEERAPAGLPFAQRLELLLQRQLDLVERRREMFEVLFTIGSLAVHPDGDLDPLELRVRAFADWMRRNASGDDLGGCRPEDAACLLVGASIAFMHRWVRAGARKPLTQHAKVIVDLFFHGVGGAGRGADARVR